MKNIYLELTEQFNRGMLRAILTSGQAVVLHRLAIMSKDGDWIVREDEQCLNFILKVLEEYGAHYRFGAPLDLRWLQGGWSCHFQFVYHGLRVRTDFFSRPPRISAEELQKLWGSSFSKVPFTDARTLSEMKKTMREKDYPIIGELARKLSDPGDQLLYSRSAEELIALAQKFPELVRSLIGERPLLAQLSSDISSLEAALDQERRRFMKADRARLEKYETAAKNWSREWVRISEEIDGLPLSKAHDQLMRHARGLLPCTVPGVL